MKVDVIKVGFLKENCYILSIGKDVILIDPGDEYHIIKEKLSGLNLCAILITHRHFDHIGALDDLIKDYNVPVLEYSNIKKEDYSYGPFNFKAIFTPGHSMDSVTYYFEKDNTMFVGDFIFNGTIGRCDLKGGDERLMEKSIELIKQYKNCTIFPGHGDKTTLDFEKKNNPYF